MIVSCLVVLGYYLWIETVLFVPFQNGTIVIIDLNIVSVYRLFSQYVIIIYYKSEHN
jgi:hypothetical protein